MELWSGRVTTCRSCGHDRLLHDSWGCKTKCGCRVSIIYLTPDPLAKRDEAVEREILKMGNQLDGQTDRLGESHLRELFERAVAEQGE